MSERDIFELVKERNRIEDVMGEAGVTLRGSGKYIKWDQHDSFMVDVEWQSWKAWGHNMPFLGMGETGDVIGLVQAWKRVDVKGAVEWLAQRAGLPPVAWSNNPERKKMVLAQRAQEDALTLACRAFVNRLRGNEEAMAYALGRGWTEETIKQAGLGYSGDGSKRESDELRRAMLTAGVDVESPGAVAVLGYKGNVSDMLTRAGLPTPVSWVSYDWLGGMPGGCLVYPHVYGGRVKYVSGRLISGLVDERWQKKLDGGQKSWNPYEPVVGKRHLYFNHTYRTSEERVVVVEGQPDAITLGQWGIPAVALAGSSLRDTEMLARVIEQHEQVFVGMDNDEAGEKMARSVAYVGGPLVQVVVWMKGADKGDANDWLKSLVEKGVTTVEKQVVLAEKALETARTWMVRRAVQIGMMVGTPKKTSLTAFMRTWVTQLSKQDLALYRDELKDALGMKTVSQFNQVLKSIRENMPEDEDDVLPEIVETLGEFVYIEDDPDGNAVGWLLETVFDPDAERGGVTRLVYRDPAGNIGEAKHLDIGGLRYVPEPPNQMMQMGVVNLPPGVAKDDMPTRELYLMVKDFIYRYYDFRGDTFWEAISAYYVLFTYLYDAFGVVPYLHFLGGSGTGKSAFLERIGMLCYRMTRVDGAATFSPIFRLAGRYKGTMIMDEMDMSFSDTESDVVKFINTGFKKTGVVLRSGSEATNFDPEGFPSFCPKIIASRKEFQDDAVANRTFRYETKGGAIREGIPAHENKLFYIEAREIQRHLLRWRMKHWQEEIEVDEVRDYDRRLEVRLNQIAMPLLKIVDDDEMRQEIKDFLYAYNKRMVMQRNDSLEAKVLQGIVDIYIEGPQKIKVTKKSGDKVIEEEMIFVDLTMQNIAKRVNAILDMENDVDVSDEDRKGPRLKGHSIGKMIDKTLHLNRTKRTTEPFKGRRELVWDERNAERIMALCERYGVEFEVAEEVQSEPA